jgi:hypothetical protein
MPVSAPKECRSQGCRALTRTGYCDEHHGVPKQQQLERGRQQDKQRTGDPLRNLYKTVRWQHIRRSVLVRDIVCQDSNGCNQRCTVVDHIINAREWTAQGNDFHDEDNLQGLCKWHHDTKTAMERRNKRTQ